MEWHHNTILTICVYNYDMIKIKFSYNEINDRLTIDGK